MSRDIGPDVMAALKADDAYTASSGRNKRIVKLERGKMWVVRFLPARLGPSEMFFARIARHWLAMKPTICPRHTAEDFGGDPQAYCPCCEASDGLNQSSDEEISKHGFEMRAVTQYMTWCVVFEKDGVEQPLSEILNPYEFWHYKTTWEELKGFFRAGTRRTPQSVTDYKLGNDFAVTKTGKGMRLDKLDSASIFDLKDPKFNDYIAKIEEGIKQPQVKIPSERDLEIVARKMEELAQNGGVDDRRDDRRPMRRRPVPREVDDVDSNEQPHAPARRGAPTQEAAAEEDDIPMDYPPQRRAAPAAAPQRRSQPLEEEPQDEAPPARTTRRAAPAEPSVEDEAPPARPTRRPAPSEPEDNEPEAAPARPPLRGKLPQTPARARMEAAASDPQSEAEEEALPEEASDSAPPARRQLDESGEGEPPPAPVRQGRMGDAVKNKVRGALNRGG